MTRVIAGSARGRRLVVPSGDRTRPTADRAREGLFSSLVSLVELEGCRFADLYAGSGAVGLEALSRGAQEALFVEDDAAALAALRANLTTLSLPGATVVGDRVERVVAGPPPGGAFDVVFADPPYSLSDDAVERLLLDLVAGGWLEPGAVVVLERASRSPAASWPAGLAAVRDRRYGEATLRYGRSVQGDADHRLGES